MAPPKPQSSAIWLLAERQHGVVGHHQLRELGFTPEAIRHRLATGLLQRVTRGVYTVGRHGLGRHGRWSAALLSCGPKAVLSHGSAAALWQLGPQRPSVEVSVPLEVSRRRRGVVVHRRSWPATRCVVRREGLRVTTPVLTLVDLAPRMGPRLLERAINEVDRQGLADPEELRSQLRAFAGRPGVARLREMLDRRTFTLTDSELERRFLPIAAKAGLARPQTRQLVNGFRVDFLWPELGLVVETDGLRYHRTPGQQARDRLRDQTHTAAGLTPLRFTHGQVAFEADRVHQVLEAVASLLARG